MVTKVNICKEKWWKFPRLLHCTLT